jgi:signal peptidase I
VSANIFPMILIGATVFTGVVWLLEIFFLRARRLVKEGAEEEPQPHVIVEYSISFFPVILLVLLFRSFLLEPFQIPSRSMVPTLEVGDFIVVSKFAYGLRVPVLGTKFFSVGDPQNGDVMVFIPPEPAEQKYFIKRVIGIPGDTVIYDENKVLYINGETVERKVLARLPPARPRTIVYQETIGDSVHRIHTSVFRRNPGEPCSGVRKNNSCSFVIPEGRYLMMGDNRDESSDSRSWGLAEDQNIIGKAFAIWVHKDPGFNLPTFKRNGMIP